MPTVVSIATRNEERLPWLSSQAVNILSSLRKSQDISPFAVVVPVLVLSGFVAL